MERGGGAGMAGIFLTLALVAAAVYGVMVAKGSEGARVAAVVKTFSVAALALAGWGLQAPGWIVAGLALGAVGDFALTRAGERAFLAGMAAFAAGHLAYAVGFGLRGVDLLAGDGLGLWGVGAVVLLVASTEVWLAPFTGALRGPVRGYALVIGVMAGVVVLLPAQDGLWMLRLGAGLFVASDVLLAVRVFRVRDAGTGRILSAVLWPCYWLGQALILLGSVVYGAEAG